MKKVFLSFSTPITNNQKSFLNITKEYISTHGCLPITVENVDSKKLHPIFSIINKLNECSLFICVAFHKYKYNDLWYSSSWLDIEYALALSMNIPCIVIIENPIGKGILVNSDSLPTPICLPNLNNGIVKNEVDIIKFLDNNISFLFNFT